MPFDLDLDNGRLRASGFFLVFCLSEFKILNMYRSVLDLF